MVVKEVNLYALELSLKELKRIITRLLNSVNTHDEEIMSIVKGLVAEHDKLNEKLKKTIDVKFKELDEKRKENL